MKAMLRKLRAENEATVRKRHKRIYETVKMRLKKKSSQTQPCNDENEATIRKSHKRNHVGFKTRLQYQNVINVSIFQLQ
jgi:L-rhamnose mutarotase